ncbi:MAG: hypothetical protein AB7O57_04625 [Hyphomicrobiaceae bacterium]
MPNPNYGFGPTGPRAASSRPEPAPDTYGIQTWFRNSTEKGKEDGTVVPADWLNNLIGERLSLAQAAGVPPPGNGPSDGFLVSAITKLIRSVAAAAMPSLLANNVALRSRGGWDARLNVPTLGAATRTNAGVLYRVETAGTTMLSGNSEWLIGDLVYSDGTKWHRLATHGPDIPAAFGAVGDGANNDTLAFTTLEATSYEGAIVDLCGRTYLVNDLPSRARYFNGAFRVGGTVYPRPSTPVRHPLDGVMTVVNDFTDRDFWEMGTAQIKTPTETRLFRWRLEMKSHVLDTPGVLKFEVNEGTDWIDTRTIYSDVDTPLEPFCAFGKLGPDRIGGLYQIDDGGTIRTRCAYSDDYGATWTHVDTGLSGVIQPYGDVQPWLAECGGHDTDGFRVWAYANGGSGGIYVYQTDDKGETWEVVLAHAVNGVVTSTQEPTVVRTPYGYIMMVRSPGQRPGISFADLAQTSWTPFADAGVEGGSNPIFLVYADGLVHYYLFTREVLAQGRVENSLEHSSETARWLQVKGTGKFRHPSSVIARVPWSGTGYMWPLNLGDGHWMTIFKAGERTLSTNPATARAIMITTHGLPVSGRPYEDAVRISLIENGDFDDWSQGDTFTGVVSQTETADGWFTYHGGATITVERVDLPPEVTTLLGNGALNGLKWTSTVQPSTAGISRYYTGEQVKRIAETVFNKGDLTWMVAGSGPVTGKLRGRVYLNPGTGGTIDGAGGSVLISNGSAVLPHQTDAGDGAYWYAEATIGAVAHPEIVWGTDPIIYFLIENYETSPGTFTLATVDVVIGRSRPFRPRAPKSIKEKVICRKYTANATWTKRRGLVKVRVWGVGGGSGTPDLAAGASQINVSSGGSSGTYGEKIIAAANLGATEAITIGDAGTPLTPSYAAGATSFGAHLVLPGGAGASAGIGAGAGVLVSGVGTLPTDATGADWSVRGMYGHRGYRLSGTVGQAGDGASTPLGVGGRGATAGGTGQTGTGYGSGAGGACANDATTRTGGTGRPGVLFVEEFYI